MMGQAPVSAGQMNWWQIFPTRCAGSAPCMRAATGLTARMVRVSASMMAMPHATESQMASNRCWASVPVGVMHVPLPPAHGCCGDGAENGAPGKCRTHDGYRSIRQRRCQGNGIAPRLTIDGNISATPPYNRPSAAGKVPILFRSCGMYISLAKPAYTAYALVSINTHWNNFLWPLIVINSVNSWPLYRGAANFFRHRAGGGLDNHHCGHAHDFRPVAGGFSAVPASVCAVIHAHGYQVGRGMAHQCRRECCLTGWRKRRRMIGLVGRLCGLGLGGIFLRHGFTTPRPAAAGQRQGGGARRKALGCGNRLLRRGRAATGKCRSFRRGKRAPHHAHTRFRIQKSVHIIAESDKTLAASGAQITDNARQIVCACRGRERLRAGCRGRRKIRAC